MKWVKRNHPKKAGFKGIIGTFQYVIQYTDGAYRIDRWMGDRWLKGDAGANKIVRYMRLE